MAAQLNYGYSTPKGVAGGKFDIAYDEVVKIKWARDSDLPSPTQSCHLVG